MMGARRLTATALALAAACVITHGEWPEAAAQGPSFPTVTRTVRFSDAAAQSTFTYTSNNDFREHKYFPQPMCGGVALIDYDGDGKMDVFFTNGSRLPDYTRPDASFYNCLLRGRGDGTFEEVTARANLTGKNLDFSFGVAAGDYDNDGFTDLFIANAGPNALFHNNGNGTFSPGAGFESKPPGTNSAWAGRGSTTTMTGCSTCWWPTTPYGTPRRPPAASIPRWVKSIAAQPDYVSVPNQLFHNLGNGRFEDVTEKSGFSTAKGKGMGISSLPTSTETAFSTLLVVNDTERNFLYINQGNGTFQEQGSPIRRRTQ